jgi:V8-like Glu-specific endopeptidase
VSHQIGTVQQIVPPLTVGPDSGGAATSPNEWLENVPYTPAPTGTKFLILHFSNVNLPANNRLEVDLGYETDVFSSTDGASFWTRPIDPTAFAGGTVPVRYITNGAANGSAQLDSYARGERHAGEQDPSALSNCDPFLHDATYVEPIYDPFWFCPNAPDWENVACIPAGDIRAQVKRSVGMIVTVEMNEAGTELIVSSCSVTLIGPDTVLTAGHCHTPEEALSASVIFNYEPDCDGGRPPGYSGHFYKVVRVEAQKYQSPIDYSILQLRIPGGGLGLTPIPLRHDLPLAGEQVFNISHPNGAVKKLSERHSSYATVAQASATGIVVHGVDVSGGSSGSGLFDTSGRYLGILSNGGACSLSWYPIASALLDIATMPGVPPVSRDVMVVFDRSGSMAADAGTGRTKIEEARDAAALFVELVRAAAGNRVGLVSFSTTATSPADFPIANLSDANKTALVGPAPYTGGVVGGLVPGGTTTIGGGLDAARTHFPTPGANPRAILLLTDGLQNTPPMIADVTGGLAGIDVHAIGFGTEANLDGALLSQLAESHNGLYTRAGSPLDLKKFFALAFGNIFEAGALSDPPRVLAAGQAEAAPLQINVFDEETITIVVGWDGEDVGLDFRVNAPSGTLIAPGAPGLDQAAGLTWRFLRIPLPQGGEREGQWSITVLRAGGRGEFEKEREIDYFISVIANGGPRLWRITPERRYFTGDAINPLVQLGYPAGGWPPNAKINLTVTKPKQSTGELLTHAPQQGPIAVDGDTIPARQATLAAISQQTGSPAVQYEDVSYNLYDDAGHTRAFEASGLFGDQIIDLFTAEGDYTFHYQATYGDNYTADRELSWSTYVDAGIDPAHSDLTTSLGGQLPDGSRSVVIVVTPRDRYGNHLGPGRTGDLTISGTPGTSIAPGAVQDNGDGSYTVTGTWDPTSGEQPAVVIGQPGRASVPLATKRHHHRWWIWPLLCLILLIIAVLLLILLITK